MKSHKLQHSLLLSLLIVTVTITMTSCGRTTPTAVPTVPPTAAPTMEPTADAAAASSAPTETSVGESAITAPFDRHALLAAIADQLILPKHAQLVTEAELLATNVAAFAATPSAESLAAAQAQWRATALAWADVEVYGLRFTMLVQSEIKKWPVNTHFIEKFLIEEETIDTPFVAATGSSAKGLAAIEYFLFDPALPNDAIVEKLVAEPKRMAYLVAASEDVAAKTAELYAMWSPDGGNQIQAFVDADFNDNNVQGSISMLANEMIALVEQINKSKLDYPLRGILAEAQPEAVESAFARISIPLIVRNLESMQAIFDVGFNDYLAFLQAANTTDTGAGADTGTVAARIDAQITEIIDLLEAFDAPLQDAVVTQPDAVRATRDAVRALIVLFKVDMANQMGITVTFGDNDGD